MQQDTYCLGTLKITFHNHCFLKKVFLNIVIYLIITDKI